MELDNQFKTFLILIAGTLITIGLVVAAHLSFGDNANNLVYGAICVANATIGFKWYMDSTTAGDEDTYERGEIVALLFCGLLLAAALVCAGFFTSASDHEYAFYGAVALGVQLVYQLYDAKIVKPSKTTVDETKPKSKE